MGSVPLSDHRDNKLIYNHGHNILRIFDVLSNFPFIASETKRIISNKHGIYELANDLGRRILRNQEISGRSQSFIELA